MTVKIINIPSYAKSLAIWYNADSNEWQLARNSCYDEPHVGVRTDAIFSCAKEAAQWALYNYGSTLQVWRESSDGFILLNGDKFPMKQKV